MHPTDRNLHALERHLAEIEANTVDLWEGYCGTCDVFHELPIDQGNCPECDDDLHDPQWVKDWFDQAGYDAVKRIEGLEKALAGLVEKYKEIVTDDDAGRSLQDEDLIRAELALTDEP